MRKALYKNFLMIVILYLATLTSAQASVERVINVHIPAHNLHEDTSQLMPVHFLTWYATPEVYASATFWPYYYNTPHKAQNTIDANLAHISGIKVSTLECYPPENKPRTITLDVTAMQSVANVSHADILKLTLQALEKNLSGTECQNPALHITGLDKHATLQDITVPSHLFTKRSVD